MGARVRTMPLSFLKLPTRLTASEASEIAMSDIPTAAKVLT